MKRLIEHRLPLAEVSAESAREKSIRHGHISTLHIWWARRPLAASRAAVFATLVPDSEENYELVKKIVPWEAVKDGNNKHILEARRKVLEANGGKPPKVLDPFAGGGAIPLEALRLGCETYALDLNPVAHLIQRATLEFPQKFGQPGSRPVPSYILSPRPPLPLGEGVKGVRAYIRDLARELRQRATEAESLLWQALRNRQLEQAKFRRQHPIGRYICDFYCHEARLIIELDGSVHDEPEQAEYDRTREAELKAQGYTILRFRNQEVLENTEEVLGRIADALAAGRFSQGSLGFNEDSERVTAYKQNPLAAEVRYWGEWVLEHARSELAEFYPADPDGKTPVAYLWARTVTCTNPTCRAEVPLVRQWWLAKKPGKRLALSPQPPLPRGEGAKGVRVEVVEVGSKETWPDEGTITRGNAVCPVCSTAVPNEVIRQQGMDGKIGQRMTAVVLSDPKSSGKSYRVPTQHDLEVFSRAQERLSKYLTEQDDVFTIGGQKLSPLPDEPINIADKRNFWVGEYGPKTWGELFNPRQALSLVTFAKWVREAHAEMRRQGMDEEWARAVATYLGIAVDRLADKNATQVFWHHIAEFVDHVFARQALPMVWNYAEATPLTSIGWDGAIEWIYRVIDNVAISSCNSATVLRGTATRIPLEDNSLDAIITDPPYYDAVPYADLSDFFYVWLRRTVGHLYPEHFRTPLTPKAQEAVQNPVRHGGNNDKAKAFFEDMMAQAFKEMHRVLKPKGQATIVFAHKSTDAWETLITALIKAGFTVEASWPLHTEMATRLRARGSAALASSTFLNCSKRSFAPSPKGEGRGEGPIGYFNQVRQEMQAAIRPQLKEFWDAGIRGADFFMSAIGPGLESYSRYDEVRRASGEPVSVGEFLDEVRKIVMEFALQQVLSPFAPSPEGRGDWGVRVDEPSQFALLTLWAYGYELPSDEARKLAQSSGIELDALSAMGLVAVKGEKALLVTAKARYRKDNDFGLPTETAPQVPIIDAIQRALVLLPKGHQALSDYLEAVNYRKSESFWRTTQAFAEVLGDDEDEGRALDELLTLRDNLPQPSQAAQAGLFT
jgi:adenine-specific DNA methylase